MLNKIVTFVCALAPFSGAPVGVLAQSVKMGVSGETDLQCKKAGSACSKYTRGDCCKGYHCQKRPRVCKKNSKASSESILEWKEASGAVEIKLDDGITSECLLREYDVEINSFLEEGSHFFTTAVASNDDKTSNDEECPSALAFASIDGHKVTYLIPNKDELKNGFHSHLLGKASLKDIIEAESSAEPVDDSKYDLTSNSCVHYAGRIWRGLKFDETVELADFLTENLLRDDGFLGIARKKAEEGGLRVLTEYALGTETFKKYVKNTVVSQLNIK